MEPNQVADLCDSLARSSEKNRRQAHRSRIRSALVAMFAVFALVLATMTGLAVADRKGDAPVTPATEIHGLPGNNPGNGNGGERGACPNGIDGCDGGLHNIAGVRATPSDHVEPKGCDAHGGLGTVNKNCVDD